MGYCIYYKDSEPKLRFTKKEHVIPAGLGGIEKLPIGYVSDEANELFSLTEREVLRNSILSVNRENVGPGKRGSMNVKKVKSPNVYILKSEDEDGDNYKLGFVFAGEAYMIPQLVINFNDANLSYTTFYVSTVLNNENGKQIIFDFGKNLTEFFLNKNRTYELIEMPFQTNKHFILIGMYKGKWYAATSHKIINMNYLSIIMLENTGNSFNKQVYGEFPKSLQHYRYQFKFDGNSFYFLYIKTAFNALAFFKGHNFVCQDIFDPVRNAVLNKTDNICNFVMDFEKPPNLITEIIRKVPEKNHYVIITRVKNIILAYVSFYK
jgi:hypothetical protein